ncbi:hypothetical protein PROFUN_10837 [Planoprotostelium fungivorum]|uniref:Uncharacterized protein n=1 Tax=Planoprotostelium fungivorum TaxID=1890364 RepID=A0A2P6NCQ6_9EUKA|nr:hypothetical protein PROFUN_10837 [Planoprotostelium fungivorum]
MTLLTDRAYCTDLMDVLKNISKQQQQLSYNQRYMYGVIHKLGQLQDPYCFTGFVRCSLYYTQEQRELTKNFPPLAEKVQLDESVQVSGYMDYLKTQLKPKHNKTTLQTEKLMYNLFPKAQLLYEVIEQPIDYVLKDYVEDMTANRQKAEDGIFQKLFKLMVNSGFRKMLQSDDKYNKSLLIHSPESFMKQTIGRTITDWSIMRHADKQHKGLIEVRLQKDKCNMKSAKHVGSAILSWSKVLMLDFVCNCLYQHYDKTEVDLLYTDTDSIYMQAKVSSYEEFKQRFPDHLQKLHFAATGDITPGKMKLECELKEAIFVKPKTYSYVKKDGKEDVRNKGVVLSQNKEILIFDSYKRAVFSDDLIMAKNTLIRKTTHNDTLSMNTMTVTKAALDGWYDKRIMIDNIHTVPFGLYSKQFSEEDVMNRIMKNLAARVNIGLSQLKTYLMCTQDQLKAHLASQFYSGMSLMNYGVLWNLDHTIPVSFICQRQPKGSLSLFQYSAYAGGRE